MDDSKSYGILITTSIKLDNDVNCKLWMKSSIGVW
uniref:Uncharacterized protein n=1 Tax=Rhizophora mucronata TaxID=61149 RepID=A0A2P2PFE7_RHIMU